LKMALTGGKEHAWVSKSKSAERISCTSFTGVLAPVWLSQTAEPAH